METRDTEEKPLLSTSYTGKEHFIIDRSQIYIIVADAWKVQVVIS